MVRVVPMEMGVDMAVSGFVDLQVNGYAGINFSDPGLTAARIERVARELYQRGTLAFCPTVVTAAPEVYRAVLPLLAEAILSAPRDGHSHLLGLHLEGPFISPEDGARGVHPFSHVMPPSLAFLEELDDLARGQIALLTLAPEQPGALDVVRRAAQMGIVVSIGHTLATAAEIRAAVQAGARLSTHLGNGLPNLIHRHRNPLWPQLAAPELSAMLITDGHHLPPDMIAALLAAKGIDRVIVTSDVAPVAGQPPGEYEFAGSRILLEPSGRLRSLESDNLAGSSATMLDCMNVLAGLGLLSESDLWRAGRDNPLAVLGMDAASLPQGCVRFQSGKFELL